MSKLFSAPVVASIALLLAACGSTAEPTTNAVASGDDGGTAAEIGSGTGAVATKFKTHVILGDSISDTGGEAPFYYALLDQNDDTKYPEAKGLDYKTVYGADLKVVKNSRNGAKTVNVASQAVALPASLPGPVLVTITVGGNDVQAAIGTIVAGGDDTPARNDFARYLNDTLTELTKPNRFGDGVQVKVVLTNIYDPSDGTGNFTYSGTGRKCGGALGFYPANKPTAPLLDPWQKVMEETVAKYPAAVLLDLRGTFQGHGVSAADTWFVADCIHPNAKGHDALRDLFWTGTIKQ